MSSACLDPVEGCVRLHRPQDSLPGAPRKSRSTSLPRVPRLEEAGLAPRHARLCDRGPAGWGDLHPAIVPGAHPLSILLPVLLPREIQTPAGSRHSRSACDRAQPTRTGRRAFARSSSFARQRRPRSLRRARRRWARAPLERPPAHEHLAHGRRLLRGDVSSAAWAPAWALPARAASPLPWALPARAASPLLGRARLEQRHLEPGGDPGFGRSVTGWAIPASAAPPPHLRPSPRSSRPLGV